MTPRYISALEYMAAPTAVDTGTLTYGGNANAQSAELVHTINRASAWCDSYVNQISLVASTRTWTGRLRIARNGDLVFHPGDTPFVSLTSLALGSTADALVAVGSSTLAKGWIDTVSQGFILPYTIAPFPAPIQLSSYAPSSRFLATATYIAGYPSTWLTATVNSAATTITVNNQTGITAGTVLTIVDGSNTEQVTVATTPTTNTITVSAIAYTHTFTAGEWNQIAVHAMPEDVRLAAIYVTSALIKSRGNDSLVMGQLMQAGAQAGPDPVTASNFRMARDILNSYKRVK